MGLWIECSEYNEEDLQPRRCLSSDQASIILRASREALPSKLLLVEFSPR